MRQFLAIALPPVLLDPVLELHRRWVEDLAGWRWVRPESLHLTVRFLGEVGEELDRRSRPAWRAAAAEASPITLTLGDTGVFPERGRPRVLWLGLRETTTPPVLDGLARGIESSARALGFPAEVRRFRPHLTLGRALRGARPGRPASDRSGEAPRGRIDRLVLYRSRLGPGGARYTEVEAYPLGPEPGEARARGGPVDPESDS